MKKVLFGLLALSAVSMAATITGSETATQGTNVWNTTQTHGEIQIKGTITSDVPVVKYVVFAGDSKESELILPDLLINKNSNGLPVGRFVSTPSNVYVKKVDSTGTLQDLDPTEIVSMKTNIDSGDPNFLSNLNWTTDYQKNFFAIGTMGKTGLEDMVASIKGKYGPVTTPMNVVTNGNDGYYINTDNGNFLGGTFQINVYNNQTNLSENGKITLSVFGAVVDNGFENSIYWPMVMDYLAGGKTMTPNFKLMVKVN